jgi:hypothetical protein
VPPPVTIMVLPAKALSRNMGWAKGLVIVFGKSRRTARR